jgi:transposase InsO family protein
LLYGRRRVPYWPLDVWANIVGDVLQYVSPGEHLESFCVALNNAALIELHLGRPAEARTLCLAQIDLLAATSGELRAAASRYIWQPIINVVRLDAMLAPTRCYDLFASLGRLLVPEQSFQLFADLRAGIECAIESASETGIQNWIREVVLTESVAHYLKTENQQGLSNIFHATNSNLDFAHPSLVLAEAELLLSFWRDGLRPLESLDSLASTPYVVSLCHLLRWFSAIEVQAVSATDILSVLSMTLDSILGDDKIKFRNYELAGWLTLSLAELIHTRPSTKQDYTMLRRALSLFEDIGDEIWQFRMLTAMPLASDTTEKLGFLKRTSRYKEIMGRNQAEKPTLPPLRDRLMLNA